VEAALNKIIIPKNYNREELKKIYNLSMVSATCDVLGLNRNTYNEVYYNASKITPKLLQNRERIQTYLRESHVDLQTLQMFQKCFLKCDKNRLG
jgi:hypothetical protein